MKIFKWQYLIAFLVLCIGVGGLFAYDLYLQPHVFAKDVVKVKAGSEGIPKNHKLEASDVYVASVPTDHAPTGYISNVEDIVGKRTSTNMTNGMILTTSLILDDNLQPNEDEGIFPIPKDSIYAINGSLRSGDKVDLYLVEDSVQQRWNQDNASGLETETDLKLIQTEKFEDQVTVAYVRTEDNNDVKDSEDGKSTNRQTSTGRVSTPELLLKKEVGEELGRKITSGYLLWVVRVE